MQTSDTPMPPDALSRIVSFFRAYLENERKTVELLTAQFHALRDCGGADALTMEEEA